MKIQATQIRVGMCIEMKNEPYIVMTTKHVTPGKGQAIVSVVYRNLKTGSQKPERYSSSDKVERVNLNSRKMQYLYQEQSNLVFMDNESYEQVPLSEEFIGENKLYLLPDTIVDVQFYNDDPVGIELPKVVELTITETEPVLKGATATNSPKPATLETGLTLQVPPFIDSGQLIRVDTTTGEYIERA